MCCCIFVFFFLVLGYIFCVRPVSAVACGLWPLVLVSVLCDDLASSFCFFFLCLLSLFVVLLLSYYLLQILHLFLIVVRPVGEEKKDKGSAMGMDFVCVELHCCTASATNYKCGTQRYGNF